LNRNQAALCAYDLLISRCDGARELSLQENVARALASKGIVLCHLNRREEALQAYDLVIEKYGESTEPSLQNEVARALAGKAAALAELGRSEEEIDSYNSVIEQLLRMNRTNATSLGMHMKMSTNGHKP
jgi:tetratricopeptide (TPR) repeat protein